MILGNCHRDYSSVSAYNLVKCKPCDPLCIKGAMVSFYKNYCLLFCNVSTGASYIVNMSETFIDKS